MSKFFISIIDWLNNKFRYVKRNHHFVIEIYFKPIIYYRKGDKNMNDLSGECVMEYIWW